MKVTNFIEVLDAAHLSHYVKFDFEQRGGIMIVGPPASWKSTVIKIALNEYPNALVLSDINVQQLIMMRDDLAAGRYITMGFLEMEKIYQRNPAVAANTEGHIKAIVEEGFTIASFEDQRKIKANARCCVMGAMTYALYDKKFSDWMKGGFARRFLWCAVRMEDPEMIMNAIHEGKLVDLDGIPRRMPSTKIPYTLTEDESRTIRKMVREQPGQETPYVLLKKIACVLKWKYQRVPDPSRKTMDILKDFATCLTRSGAEMVL